MSDIMIGSFSYDGVESSEFDLVCRSVKRPLLPLAKIKRVELPGASGSYDFPGSEYGLRSLSMRILYIGKDFFELRGRARKIAAWLGKPETWTKLILNDEPDKYYLVRITSDLDLDAFFELGSVTITFDCQPFAYSVLEENLTFTASGNHTFVNPGTREINYRSPQGSKFTVSLTGSWTNLATNMNGNQLGYSTAGNGTLIFDSVNMEATLGGVNAFERLTGDYNSFFKVLPGTNTLSVTGLTGTINVSYIPMWL